MEKRAQLLKYNEATIEDMEFENVIATLKSGWLSRGAGTNAFEEKFKALTGAKYAIAMNSATAALHIALLCAGVGEGDEVITTPLTFASSANTIIHCGATPVFVDIDPETMCIDPSKIEEKITERTKAIVPVHFAGHSCDMDAIIEIAKKHDLFVSEDAAHAVYTKYKDRMIGNVADATSFSFYATKNICTGEGGMLTTNDPEIASKAREISLHGMTKNAWNRYDAKGSWRYDISFPGFKYNMTGIQAALGIAQIDKIEDMQKKREYIAEKFNNAFMDNECIITPAVKEYTRHAWHIYYIQLKTDKLKVSRDEFIELMKEYQVQPSVHFLPVHLMTYYKERYGYKQGDFPNAELYSDRTISIPLYPNMSDEDVKYVIDVINFLVKNNKR